MSSRESHYSYCWRAGIGVYGKIDAKPTLDIANFDGNAILYRRFVSQFNNYVSSFCRDPKMAALPEDRIEPAAPFS